MPYIITTHNEGPPPDEDGTPGAIIPGTHRVVATLDEARQYAHSIVSPFDADATPAPDDDLNDYSRSYFRSCADVECMEEHGGTVGPLPDGTVIEVVPTSRAFLLAAVPVGVRASFPYGEAGDIDAYNAAQRS